jgi:hypothetical protein
MPERSWEFCRGEGAQQGKKPDGKRFVTTAAAGAPGWGVTMKNMSDTGSSGNRPSLGAMLGTGAGKAFRVLRGNPGPKRETASLGALLGRGAGRAFRALRGNPGRQSQQSSLGTTLGSGAGTAYGKLRGEPGRNKRYVRGFRSGAAVFFQSAKGTLRVLFLELSGVMFLCFMVIIVSAFIREYRKFATHQVGLERVLLAGAVSVMFFYFGLSSFWRARRKKSRVQE